MDYKKQLEEVDELQAETLTLIQAANVAFDQMIIEPLSIGFGWREGFIVLSAVSLGIFQGLYVL